MARKIWNVDVDGIQYEVAFRPKGFSKGFTVNGERHLFDKPKILGHVSETHFILGSKPAVISNVAGKADLAVDGIYLDSKEPFVSIQKLPGWAWVFIVLNGLIFCALGAIPVALSFLGISLSIRFSLAPNSKIGMKITLCTLITLMNYIILFAIILLSSMIRN